MDTQPSRTTPVVNLLEYKATRASLPDRSQRRRPLSWNAAWLLPSPRRITHWRQMLTHLQAQRAATDEPS